MKRFVPLAVILALVLAVVVYARPYAPPVMRAGTPLDVVLQISLDTDFSDVGDRFSARVAAPVYVDGHVAIPAGAYLHGHVVLSDPVARDGGRGRLQLAYEQVQFDGRAYRIDSRSCVYLLGAAPRGIELPAGCKLKFTLDRDVSVRPERSA